MWYQPNESRWSLRLVNLQDALPAVPVRGIRVKLLRTGT